MKEYVVDTSVVVARAISKLANEGKIKGKIIVPHAVVSELEAQANRGQEIGFIGLEELQALQKLKDKVELEFKGDRPTDHQIRYAKAGEIDAYIRNIAHNEGAILITGDKVQAESGRAFGLEVMYIELRESKAHLEIEKFFDDHTMSVHIKENCYVYGKKGLPGKWELTQVNDKKLTGEEIEGMAKEIFEKTRVEKGSFVEIARRGSTIVQHQNYRIVIVNPPVSDGFEITVVRPLTKLNLDDYKLDEKIKERLTRKARGVIISGEVGSGKSTFCQALGEYYAANSKIVKTIESPRDLQLNDNITQYSKNFATSEELHDILFLTRPDYILYDEMRDTPDFHLYKDLRLAGSNVLGVLHAATAIDSVQRFIGRLETGMIPSILDTIIFMEAGKIAKLLTLKMLVKVPSGMTESDLARPVVEVCDYETEKLEFEIYSYGEETVVIPVNEQARKSGIKELAAKEIERFFQKYTDFAEVEVVSDDRVIVNVNEEDIARIIGKQGKNIEEIEKMLGVGIDVRELKSEKSHINFDMKEKDKHITIYTDPGRQVEVCIDGKMLLTAYSSKKGEIKIHKKSAAGRDLLRAISSGRKVEVKA